MRSSLLLRCLPFAAALWSGLSGAQAPAPAAAAAWRSAFQGYQPYAEAPLAPWRESNDTVGRIGGWRVYAREAQGAAAPDPAPGAPAVSSNGTPPGAAPARPALPAAGHTH